VLKASVLKVKNQPGSVDKHASLSLAILSWHIAIHAAVAAPKYYRNGFEVERRSKNGIDNLFALLKIESRKSSPTNFRGYIYSGFDIC
jgi:hypothetical protein